MELRGCALPLSRHDQKSSRSSLHCCDCRPLPFFPYMLCQLGNVCQASELCRVVLQADRMFEKAFYNDMRKRNCRGPSTDEGHEASNDAHYPTEEHCKQLHSANTPPTGCGQASCVPLVSGETDSDKPLPGEMLEALVTTALPGMQQLYNLAGS